MVPDSSKLKNPQDNLPPSTKDSKSNTPLTYKAPPVGRRFLLWLGSKPKDTPETNTDEAVGFFSSIKPHLNWRKLILLGISAGLGAAVSHFKEKGELGWFPDWGFDVIFFLTLFLVIVFVWTHPDFRAILRAVYDRWPKTLTPLLIIVGMIVGGAMGVLGSWRLKRIWQTQTPNPVAEKKIERNSVIIQPTQVRRILLTPGNHATPPGPACTGDGETPLRVPNGRIAIFFGDSIAYTKGIGTVIVNIDGEDILRFRRTTGELYLDAVIRELPNNEVGRIENNIITLNSLDYEILNPDAQNLVILSHGRRILSIRYVNESSIIVSGIFSGRRSGPYHVIAGESISMPERNMAVSETCFENLEGPLFIWP